MAGRGPAPKPSNLRQRKNKKSGAATIPVMPPIDGAKPPKPPEIPNPDARVWHVLTEKSWARAWVSPMAALWIETDVDAIGRLAILWDDFYKGDTKLMAEIRLQEQRFGLSPLDRSRLQWEFARGEESEKRQERRQMNPKRTGTTDPRRGLMAVK